MVVDDEPYIRNSIIKSIESINPMFSIVAESGDGLAAFELAKEQSFDVIFIDINMPIMDGIELIKELNTLEKVPICVILSGYSDFKYAQAAIQYHVQDYILKPIAPGELKNVLATIQERFLDNIYENQYHYFNHIFRGTKLKIGSFEINNSFEHFSLFHPFLVNFGSYALVKNNQFSLPTHTSYHESLEKLWAGMQTDNVYQWIISGENNNEKIVILGFKSPCTRKLLEDIVGDYFSNLTKLNIPVTLVAGTPTPYLESLVPSVIDIKYTLPSIIKYGYSSLNFHENKAEFSPDQVNCTPETLKLLRDLRDSEDKYEYLQLTNSLLVNCKKNQISQALLQSLSKQFLQIASNGIYSLDNDSFVDELITNTYSYDIYIPEYLKFLSGVLNYSEEENCGDAINNIKVYIDNHFTEEISLTLLSNKFHISISHLSVQFKKRFSVSPNEYIILKRIERAKILLQTTTSLSIKQIATMVGYGDPYYFSRIFKSITNLSPTSYQSQFQESNYTQKT